MPIRTRFLPPAKTFGLLSGCATFIITSATALIAIRCAYNAGYRKALSANERLANDILEAMEEDENLKDGSNPIEERTSMALKPEIQIQIQSTGKEQARSDDRRRKRQGAGTNETCHYKLQWEQRNPLQKCTVGRRIRRLSDTVERRICELGMDPAVLKSGLTDNGLD